MRKLIQYMLFTALLVLRPGAVRADTFPAPPIDPPAATRTDTSPAPPIDPPAATGADTSPVAGPSTLLAVIHIAI